MDQRPRVIIMSKSKQFHKCPFQGCNSSYVRKSDLKQHWLKIRGKNGDEHHSMDDSLWAKLRQDGELQFHTRPGNLSETDRAERNRAAGTRYRENHRDEMNERRRLRAKELQQSADLVNRVARIAVFALDDHDNQGTSVVRHLYNEDDVPDPKSLLDLKSPPTASTFPTIVAIFLPPRRWPEIVRATEPEAGLQSPAQLLLKQLPGQHEFDRVYSILINGSMEKEIMNSEFGEDLALAEYFTEAYEIWKPILTDETLATAQFVLHRDDPIAFQSISNQHASGFALLQTWDDVCHTMLSRYAPRYSLAQLHAIENGRYRYPWRRTFARVWPPMNEDENEIANRDEEDEDEDADEDEEEDERMFRKERRRYYRKEKNDDNEMLRAALKLKARNPGRKLIAKDNRVEMRQLHRLRQLNARPRPSR